MIIDDSTIALASGVVALVVAYIRNHYNGKYNESKHIVHTARILVDLVDDDLWDDKVDEAQFRAKFTKARDVIRNYDTPSEAPDITPSSTSKSTVTTTAIDVPSGTLLK